MYTYKYVYIYIYRYMYIYVYKYIYVRIYIYVCINTYIYKYLYVRTYVYSCMCVRRELALRHHLLLVVSPPSRICVCVCVCICVRVCVCTECTHTCVCVFLCARVFVRVCVCVRKIFSGITCCWSYHLPCQLHSRLRSVFHSRACALQRACTPGGFRGTSVSSQTCHCSTSNQQSHD